MLFRNDLWIQHGRACRGKGDCLQGQKGIRAAGVLASESALRSEIGWSWGTPTLHQTIAKPLYQDRNCWILGRTPESQNPFIRSEIGGLWGTPGTPTPSQNPFVRTETGGFWGAHRIATPLCGPSQNPSVRTGFPLGHCKDLILGKVKTSKRPCKRFRVTVSKPEARFGVAVCPKAKLP